MNDYLNEFLESAGKTDEINKIDQKIEFNKNKLMDLEKEKIIFNNNILAAEKELINLEEDSNNGKDSSIKKNIADTENMLDDLENQISQKNDDINELNEEKDEIIKKCLMKLHSEMKNNHKKVNEDHDKYVDLYTKAREERHNIERKMVYLKSLVYKNYKLRLV
ncbi:MAG: hypothetical protein HZC47_06680 [Methanobacterium sp.]|uniref:hypothetical protein n=1 Tax=Methanobacterium sp. TaxID=2164 RepID=UPI003D65CC49|nr:hypothetical protein [Methanobacterium sp.]